MQIILKAASKKIGARNLLGLRIILSLCWCQCCCSTEHALSGRGTSVPPLLFQAPVQDQVTSGYRIGGLIFAKMAWVVATKPDDCVTLLHMYTVAHMYM